MSSSRKEPQDKYLTRTPYVAKTHLFYSHPFWRDRGFSGTGITSSGVVFVVGNPPGHEKVGHGVLLAFRDCGRADLTRKKLKAYATVECCLDQPPAALSKSLSRAGVQKPTLGLALTTCFQTYSITSISKEGAAEVKQRY